MIGTGKITSILHYKGIAIDLNHTLLRYKMREFGRLYYDWTARYLVERLGYPRGISLGEEEDPESLLNFTFRSCFDRENGVFLKISDTGGRVMRAYRGTKLLSRGDVQRLYGEQCSINHLQTFNMQDPRFVHFHNLYKAVKVPLIARAVDLLTGRLGMQGKSIDTVLSDVVEADSFNFRPVDRERLRRGDFQPNLLAEILQDPPRYIHPVPPRAYERLAALRKIGKFVFLVSNTSIDKADILLESRLGKNWQDFFDMIILQAGKPDFFSMEGHNLPFTDREGKPFDPKTFLKTHLLDKVLLGGHISHLNEFFSSQFSKNFRVLLYGDSFASDCPFIFKRVEGKHWHLAHILEELREIENGVDTREYFDYRKVWGSALFDTCMVGNASPTLVFNFANNYANRTFSSFSSDENLEFLTA